MRAMAQMADEYAAARTGAARIERSDRAFIRMYGRDPLKMIQGLVTNDVAGAPPGHGVYAALLTPKGKMVSDLRVFPRKSDLLLETPAAALDNVATLLRKFVPPLFARFEPVPDMQELGVYGPAAAAALSAALGDQIDAGLAEDAFLIRSFEGDELLVVRTLFTGDEGFDVIAPAATVAALRDRFAAADIPPIGEDTLDVLRIEAGRPRWGAELSENVIPLEARIEDRAISMNKGCYTGQEVIVRIVHRGHVNWLLRGVLLGEATPPAQDTPLLHPSDARKVGRITSACVSPRHRQTIGLCYARRELEPPVDVRLERIDGELVSIVDVPFPAKV